MQKHVRLFSTTHMFNKEHSTMRTRSSLAIAAFGALTFGALIPVQDAQPEGNTPHDFVPPIVFQAAGPTAGAIQGTVDAYRAALGGPNNGNASGPLSSGRREINWDGGNVNNQSTAL